MEPSHSVPQGHCSKLKLNIIFHSAVFCAGQTLTGHLELDCTASKHVLLGQVGLELEGYEAIEEKDMTYRQVFLRSKMIFQGSRKPPSEAVYGPAIDGYWKALKKTTLFPFSFQLPHDLPSSYIFQDIASLTYALKGWAQFRYKGKEGTIVHSRNAIVIEKVSDVLTCTAKWGMNEGRPIFTQEGLVKLYIGVPQSRIQTGNELLVNVHVKNQTEKKIQGIRLKLVKKLLILETDQSIRTITETVRQIDYKGHEATFFSMSDKNLTLTLHVPTTVWTVRKTSLVEVACSIIASIDLGFLSKQVQVDIPIEVYHPSSLNHSTAILPPPPPEPQRKFPTLREARASLRRMRNFLGKQGKRMLPWEDPHDVQTPLAYQAPAEDHQFFMSGMFYISAPQRTLRMARSTQKLRERTMMQSNIPRHLGYLCEPGIEKTLPRIHPTLRDIPKKSHRHLKKVPIQEVYARMLRDNDAERTIVASSSKDLPGIPVSSSTDHYIRQLQSIQ